MRFPLPFCLAVMGAAFLSAPTLAQTEAQTANNGSEFADTNSESAVYVGAAFFVAPDYVGAQDQQARVLPYIWVNNYKGFDFRPFALSYRLLSAGTGEGLWRNDVEFGPRLAYDFGREEDDAAALTGLGDLDGSLLAGAYLRGRFGPVGYRVEGGQDLIDGSGGALIDYSVGTRLPLAKAISLTLAASAHWGSEDYNQAYFGITEPQATASVYSPYAVQSGVYAYSANAVLGYSLPRDWEATAFLNYRAYQDEAKNSPILLGPKGSDKGVTAIFALSKRFGL